MHAAEDVKLLPHDSIVANVRSLGGWPNIVRVIRGQWQPIF